MHSRFCSSYLHTRTISKHTALVYSSIIQLSILPLALIQTLFLHGSLTHHDLFSLPSPVGSPMILGSPRKNGFLFFSLAQNEAEGWISPDGAYFLTYWKWKFVQVVHSSCLILGSYLWNQHWGRNSSNQSVHILFRIKKCYVKYLCMFLAIPISTFYFTYFYAFNLM